MEILTTPIPDHRAVELRIVEQDVPFSFQEVAQRWQEDAKFCEQFNQALADAPYESYRWELPGLTRENGRHLSFASSKKAWNCVAARIRVRSPSTFRKRWMKWLCSRTSVGVLS